MSWANLGDSHKSHTKLIILTFVGRGLALEILVWDLNILPRWDRLNLEQKELEYLVRTFFLLQTITVTPKNSGLLLPVLWLNHEKVTYAEAYSEPY